MSYQCYFRPHYLGKSILSCSHPLLMLLPSSTILVHHGILVASPVTPPNAPLLVFIIIPTSTTSFPLGFGKGIRMNRQILNWHSFLLMQDQWYFPTHLSVHIRVPFALISRMRMILKMLPQMNMTRRTTANQVSILKRSKQEFVCPQELGGISF